MRVITGTAKGILLHCVSERDIRPTGDRVKEALFSIIQENIYGKRILDLFAGTGALGIEALSRGAESAVFVDSFKEAERVIKLNLNKTRLESKATVINRDALAFLMENREKFHVIFIDPPYKSEYIKECIEKIIEKKVLEEDGVIVSESDDEARMPEKPPGLIMYSRRKYGRTFLNFYKIGID